MIEPVAPARSRAREPDRRARDEARQSGERIVRRRLGVGWLGLGVLMATLLGLGACGKGTVQNALGMGKRSPDEFRVVSRAP